MIGPVTRLGGRHPAKRTDAYMMRALPFSGSDAVVPAVDQIVLSPAARRLLAQENPVQLHGGRAPGHSIPMTCPVCSGEFQQVVKDNVLIDVCTRCRGVWLDPGELEALLAVPARGHR